MYFAIGVCMYIGRHSISIQRKLQVADLYNRINRLKEEEKLLFTEMKQFIIYFKDTIPSRLKTSTEGNTFIRMLKCIIFIAYSNPK